jgi:hypothetical protein
MNIQQIVEEARMITGIAYYKGDIINSSYGDGKDALVDYTKQVIDICIGHIEGKLDPTWQLNYYGGWKGAIEELKELQKLK